VRWLAHELPVLRAGTRDSWVLLEFENAGSAAWDAHGQEGIWLSYHWLDPLGNPIVWGTRYVALPWPVPPGKRVSVSFPIEPPIPPGRYRLAFDLVDEGRAWFADLGNARLEQDVEVQPRLRTRALAVRLGDGPSELVRLTKAALAGQEEPVVDGGDAVAHLMPGCRPAADWSRRVLDVHDEGYAAVAGSIEVEGSWLERRRSADELRPWRPGFGRSPGWDLSLLCPSVVADLADDVSWAPAVCGMPALDPSSLREPWLCDGRIRIVVPVRALRPAGRRSG
jgi:hypothetical protein